MKKQVLVFAIMTLILSSVWEFKANALGISVDYSNEQSKITISGNEADDDATLTILRGDELIYIDDCQINENGEYSFGPFNLELADGSGKITVNVDKGKTTESNSFYMYSANDNISDIKTLISSLENDELEAAIGGLFDYAMCSAEIKGYYTALGADYKDSCTALIKTVISLCTTEDELKASLDKTVFSYNINLLTWSELRDYLINDMKILDYSQTDRSGYNNLSTENSKNNVFRGMKGNLNDVSDIYDVISIFNQFIDKQSNTSSGNSSSGGSSSGGSSGSSKGPSTIEITSVTEDKVKQLSDLEEAPWAKQAINDMYTDGYIKGYADNTFKPMQSMTRAEFLNLVINIYDIKPMNILMDFEDVSEKDWYYETILAAVNAKIITGYEGRVYPKNNITRQDALVILQRIEGAETLSTENVKTFLDEALISDYAKSAVDYFSSINIISGDESGNINPLSNLTRAEATLILWRIKY